MNQIQVFTAFSGYDSQCMALDRIGLPYDLVEWSEIDKYAIAAHNAVYPQFAERNYADNGTPTLIICALHPFPKIVVGTIACENYRKKL